MQHGFLAANPPKAETNCPQCVQCLIPSEFALGKSPTWLDYDWKPSLGVEPTTTFTAVKQGSRWPHISIALAVAGEQNSGLTEKTRRPNMTKDTRNADTSLLARTQIALGQHQCAHAACGPTLRKCEKQEPNMRACPRLPVAQQTCTSSHQNQGNEHKIAWTNAAPWARSLQHAMKACGGFCAQSSAESYATTQHKHTPKTALQQ